MKILHTADLHLRERDDQRWQTLHDLLALADRQDVDALVVCGDLFDAAVDAEQLLSPLRRLFSGTSFDIFLLPGNHDREAYCGGRYFGDRAHVLDELRPRRAGDVTVIGLPFRNIQGEALATRLRRLRGVLHEGQTNVLLYHGELLDALPLDTSRADFGQEGTDRYMPVRLSQFADLPVRYVLAGHFHRTLRRWRLDGDRWFAYSGSPVAITRRETGVRQVNLFEIGAPPTGYPLDTPHYENVTVRLDPSDDRSPQQVVTDRLEDLHPAAMPLLRVEGYVDCAALGQTESELVEQISALTQHCAAAEFDFHDISRILENDLFQQFRQRAERMDDPDRAERLIELTLRAMREARL